MALLGQFKRDTLANWRSNNTVLADGEFALVASDSSNPKKYDYWVCGDGVTAFTGLVMGSLASSAGITGIANEQGSSESLAASQKLVTDLVNEGYAFKGVATPTTPGIAGTNPGLPSQKVFYLVGAGTYAYFNNAQVDNGYIGFLEYDGSSWNLESIKVCDSDYIRYVAQTLTNEQKTIARNNIDAASKEEFTQLSNAITTLQQQFGNFVVISEEDYDTLEENDQIDEHKFYFITEE